MWQDVANLVQIDLLSYQDAVILPRRHDLQLRFFSEFKILLDSSADRQQPCAHGHQEDFQLRIDRTVVHSCFHL